MKKLIPVLFLILLGCSKEEAPFKIGISSVSLSFNSTYTITTNFECEWSSDNEDVATVKSGRIITHHIGTTTITAEYKGEKKKCIVNVTPTSTLYKEPILTFGLTVDELKNEETHTYLDTINHGNYIICVFEDKVNYMRYNYYLKNGKTDMVEISFQSNIITHLEVHDHLIQRYNFVRNSSLAWYEGQNLNIAVSAIKHEILSDFHLYYSISTATINSYLF